MHLQLSLIDAVSPVVTSAQAQHYSPWQQTMRPTQGIVHGLYVFAVIHSAMRAVVEASHLPNEAVTYLMSRQRDIAQEIRATAAVQSSEDLTPLGIALVKRLLRPFE